MEWAEGGRGHPGTADAAAILQTPRFGIGRSFHHEVARREHQMAPKKTSRTKSRKTVARAKATRKSTMRSDRKAPRGGGKQGDPIAVQFP